MTCAAIVLALDLVTVIGPDYQQVEINPDAVVALRAPKPNEAKSFAPGVKCVMYTADGHFIGLSQTCTEVKNLLTVPIPRERPPELGPSRKEEP